MANTWQQLSHEISTVVEGIAKSIVAVDGRSGHTSSGIVWRSGYVLTAAHSIRQESGIGIITGSGENLRAQLIARDRGTDIALLKVDQDQGLAPADLGSTASLQIGEFTLAVARTRRGNIVASSGIIGGLMGEWRVGRTKIDQFIRPDLNLYSGFSGGALLDSAGTVLGLNTSGLIRGKAITIPSSTLTRVAEEIVTKGRVERPYIGLVMQPVQIPASLQKRASITASSGLLVMHVEPGGPADSAGALLGDVLVEMDGRTFDDLEDVQDAIGNKSVGQEVHATVIRGGEKREITIRLGERPIR
jgi:S1-C subfamily serine protease